MPLTHSHHPLGSGASRDWPCCSAPDQNSPELQAAEKLPDPS